MDSSLFIFTKSGLVLWVLIYVDDIIITGSDSNGINRFISRLHSLFSLKDLGLFIFLLRD